MEKIIAGLTYERPNGERYFFDDDTFDKYQCSSEYNCYYVRCQEIKWQKNSWGVVVTASDATRFDEKTIISELSFDTEEQAIDYAVEMMNEDRKNLAQRLERNEIIDTVIPADTMVYLQGWLACLKNTLGIGILIIGLQGCAVTRCGDIEPTNHKHAPVIENFDLDNNVNNPDWPAMFAVTFSDVNGDLSDGKALLYFDGHEKPLEIALTDIFTRADLLGAEEGTFIVPMYFDDTSYNGTYARTDLQLEDAVGMKSNCYSLELWVTVQTD